MCGAKLLIYAQKLQQLTILYDYRSKHNATWWFCESVIPSEQFWWKTQAFIHHNNATVQDTHTHTYPICLCVLFMTREAAARGEREINRERERERKPRVWEPHFHFSNVTRTGQKSTILLIFFGSSLMSLSVGFCVLSFFAIQIKCHRTIS